MRLKTLLEKIEMNEMPIQNFQSIGNPLDKGGSFDKTDRAILSSEKGIEKIKRIFSNSEFYWNLYFINSGRLRSKGEMGVYSFNDFQKFMDNENVDVSELKETDPSAINVVFVSNSAANKNQLSAWILAHRIGHAIRRNNPYWDQLMKDTQRELSYAVRSVYTNQYDTLANYRWDWYDSNTYTKSPQLQMLCSLGKFKSAREKKIRNCYEANYEFFAQYVINNQIKMNPMPEVFSRVRSEYDLDDRQDYADNLASMFEANFHNVCSFAKGKWLIM
jgi:hypothetical protein